MSPVVPTLAVRREMTTAQQHAAIEELQAHLKAASDSLQTVRQAIDAKDEGRLNAALVGFRKSFGPVREAAKMPTP